MESARQGSQSYACGSWFLISLSELYALFFLSVIRYFHVGRWVIFFFGSILGLSGVLSVSLMPAGLKFLSVFFRPWVLTVAGLRGIYLRLG